MLKIRHAADRGHFDHGWLNTYHSFSFADYYDADWMGFKSLWVINQDIIQPGRGFAMHSHKDMEIITLILQGSLVHKDSMGNETFIHNGEIQCMSAGTGVRHSEYNASPTEAVELLQIWIAPNQLGLEPRYQQRTIPTSAEKLQLLLSPENKSATIAIQQDAELWLGNLCQQQQLNYAIKPNRHLWLQMIKGHLQIANDTLYSGDGLTVSDEVELTVNAIETSVFLLFDLGDSQ